MQEQNTKQAVALRLANETICDRALDLMGEQALAEGNAEQVADNVKTELIQMNYTAEMLLSAKGLKASPNSPEGKAADERHARVLGRLYIQRARALVSRDEAAKGLKKADFETYVKGRVDHYVACKDADDLGMQDKVAVELLKKGANTTLQNIRRSLQNASKKSSPRTPKTENEKLLGHLQAAWKVARSRDDAIVAEVQCEAVEVCAQKCGMSIDKGNED
jgi:predicted nucleotidyltransferase